MESLNLNQPENREADQENGINKRGEAMKTAQINLKGKFEVGGMPEVLRRISENPYFNGIEYHLS